MWKKVICIKHKIEEGLGIRCSKSWCDILPVAMHRNNLLLFFVNNLQIKVGNESEILV